ncbi:MAG: glycine cleavage H-protein [Bacteroidetes bacterium]|nr:glycine cleavage H-protein [Bacteroidota bacterium]
MSLILALTVATIIILIRLMYKEAPKENPKAVLVKRYVHPGHTWMKLTQEGDVVVGVDEFGQSVIGSIDDVKLPRMLRRVRQGEIGWTVKHGHRVVPMRSPVSGRVIEKNEMVLNNPSLVNSSPYGDGWLFKVRPRKVQFQLSNLFTGRAATQWQDIERAELARFFSGTPALMLQEGGVLLQNLADRCSDAEWSAIARRFFHVDGE